MAYDITKYEPGYGGLINSAGNVVNQADGITLTGARLSANDVVAVTMQNAATATGIGLSLNTANGSMAVLDVQGTFVGTITVKATIDGTSYFSVKTTDMSNDTRVANISAAGQYSLRVNGYINIIAQITAYTSGSITVYGRASASGTSHHTVAITQVASNGDTGVAATNVPIKGNYLFNGVTWDAWKNNLTGTALAYSARTSTVSSSDIINVNHRGIIIYFYIGISSGTGSLTLMLEAKDPSGSRYRQINTSYTARTATGMTAHVLYPGASSAANNNNSDSNVLPYQFRFTVTHADSSSYSYSVAYALIM